MTLLVGELEAMEAELLAQDLDGDEFEVNHLDPDALLADLRLDESDAGDEVTGWLDATLARVGDLAVGGNNIDDASRIDRIAVLERIKASVTAAQAVEIVAFGRSQVQAQRDAGVDYRRLGRGIADQVAFACRVSPSEGSRRLNTARDLQLDLPRTLALLARGDIHDYTAQLIVAELRPLSRELRSRVDDELEQAGVAALAPREAQALARKLVCRADPSAAIRRARTARSDRRVTVRPAPDTMAILSGLLPVEQGVACFASLKAQTDRLIACGDLRTRGQIMADTLVERLTGQSSAAATPVEVHIVVPVEALFDDDGAEPADLPGYGPLPVGIVQELLDLAEGDSWWRRIFTAPTPTGRTVVDVDRRRHRIPGRSARRFSRRAARFIQARDRWCRDPYCTAPIRHLDHIVRYTDGGESTVANGRAVCERGNYVREMPGWSVRLVDNDPHTTITTTPTGHTYRSRAPDPP